MSETSSADMPHNREWHGSHQPWLYRQECFRWYGSSIVGLNFLPLAKQMRAWMTQSGVLSTLEHRSAGWYTNPYSYSGVTISLLLSSAMTAAYDFGHKSSDHDPITAEVDRIRHHNELVLYAARLSEVVIKQLLFCTAIPEKIFKRMALGQLLESPCPDCKKKDGNQPHSISMVGSLAHPFHLCLEFDHCAMNHIDLVNKLRNSQVAHSDAQRMDVRSVEESKAQSRLDADALLNDLVHMLGHVAKVEDSMTQDLKEKGNTIIRLKADGLKPEDSYFKLVPGEKFEFQLDGASDTQQEVEPSSSTK